MARTTRYPEVQLVRIEAYVHPDTALALKRRSNGQPIGALLDRIVGVVPDPLADFAFAAPVTALYDLPKGNKPPKSAGLVYQHVWKDHPTFGKVCGTCRKPKKTAEGTNCVPIDENPAEEAHLTQKGPK